MDVQILWFYFFQRWIGAWNSIPKPNPTSSLILCFFFLNYLLITEESKFVFYSLYNLKISILPVEEILLKFSAFYYTLSQQWPISPENG